MHGSRLRDISSDGPEGESAATENELITRRPIMHVRIHVSLNNTLPSAD